MKKLVKATALLQALVLCLSVTVLAAAESEPLGSIDAMEGVTASLDGDKLSISYETGESGFFLLVVKLNDGNDPNEDNILFIDQQTAANGAVEFPVVYASKDPNAVEDSVVMLYGPGLGEGKEIATIVSAVKIGDANGDKKVDSSDLIRLAQYLVGTNTISGLRAADTNADGEVNSSDLIRLAQYLVGSNTLG